MIDITNNRAETIVQIKVTDKLIKTDFKQIAYFFECEIGKEEQVNLLLLMDDWEGLTPGGILEEIKLAEFLKDVKKAAFVAESEFLKIDSIIVNLYPGIEIKYFKADERPAAEAWLKK